MANRTRKLTVLALAGLALTPLSSHAEWRCDCTRVTGSCNAKVAVNDNWVTVSSDERACSRVDYFVDGQPFVTVVIDGENKQSWLSPSASPEVMVQSCQVCDDRLISGRIAPPAAPATENTQDDEVDAPALSAMVRVDPAYPRRAADAGIEGYVVLKVDVRPDGSVAGTRIQDARPANVFDGAASDAVRRWRYPRLTGGAIDKRETTERVEFRLASRPAPATSAPDGTATADGLVTGLNWCIKSVESYDLVDIRQAQLINACADPVMFYGCAEGTDRQSGVWVCDPGTAQQTALVPRGDVRDGTEDTLSTGARDIRYKFAERHYVAYPPNTRFWWIACGIGDLDCHRGAQRWQAYLAGKPRGVHPGDASQIAVAASD